MALIKQSKESTTQSGNRALETLTSFVATFINAYGGNVAEGSLSIPNKPISNYKLFLDLSLGCAVGISVRSHKSTEPSDT